MANIYVGRTIASDGSDELVALKVMRDEYGKDPKFLRMFSDETKILARLDHPHVIRTFDSGITSDHRFIVMELLAGRPLADLWDLMAVRKKPLSLRLGAWICARIAEGLHAAHELHDERGEALNVVHRDVNPSNMFLTFGGEVKLIDFGLAKARVRRTQSADGVVKGKIPYLAPEQLTKRPIDRRIDLYALGTTLWENVTMKRLFKRDTDLETLHAIRDAVVPDVRRIVDDFPPSLHDILDRALKVDPDQRYSTAEEMRAALDAFVDDWSGEMAAELVTLMRSYFPGEEARYKTWRREAMSTRRLSTAPPPPSGSTNMMRAAPAAVIEIDDADVEEIDG